MPGLQKSKGELGLINSIRPINVTSERQYRLDCSYCLECWKYKTWVSLQNHKNILLFRPSRPNTLDESTEHFSLSLTFLVFCQSPCSFTPYKLFLSLFTDYFNKVYGSITLIHNNTSKSILKHDAKNCRCFHSPCLSCSTAGACRFQMQQELGWGHHHSIPMHKNLGWQTS